MLLAILAYSLTTGLSAFAWDWVSFCRAAVSRRRGERLEVGDRRLDRVHSDLCRRGRHQSRAFGAGPGDDFETYGVIGEMLRAGSLYVCPPMMLDEALRFAYRSKAGRIW